VNALRLHHRDYSFFWDLVDLARSAFHYTASLTPPALVPVEVPAAVAPQLVTPARRAHNQVA
jgi:hypothetical protein